MDVFLRNLPPDLTDNSLQKSLHPFLQKLSIREYICDKNRGKSIGFITFLHEQDGKKFLSHHGEVPVVLQNSADTFRSSQTIFIPNGNTPRRGHHRHPPSRARLSIFNKDVYCKISDRRLSEFVLKSIQSEVEKRLAKEATAKKGGPKESPVAFDTFALSCGHWTFPEGKLTFVAEWTGRASSAALHVKFTKRNLVIKLPSQFMVVRIPYLNIFELVWSDDGHVAVTLSTPPTFLFDPASTSSSGRKLPKVRRVSIDGEHQAVSNFCLVYCFKACGVAENKRDRDYFHEQIKKLGRNQVYHISRFDFGFQHVGFPGSIPFPDIVLQLKTNLANHRSDLPFGILFLSQALVYNCYLHPTTVIGLVQKLIPLFNSAKEAGEQYPVSVDAFRKLFDGIDYPSPHVDADLFEVDELVDYLLDAEDTIREGYAVRSGLFSENQTLTRIYRATVTPTRITLHGPEMEAKNRILRKFPNHQDHFLRVQFCDEDGQDLYLSSKVSVEDIYRRYKSVFANGISIAGRVYKFLGFSHSSLRARSAWFSSTFFHDNQIQNPEYIISTLGDFKKIRSPARCAARIGQAFSETPFTVSLDDHHISVTEIPDIIHNDRVFSDGVGTVSSGAMEAINQILPQARGWPTCYQIRWAGAKGMLSLDPTLEGNMFCVRPSMVKFEGKGENLEICDTAKPIGLVLNRQVVKILEDLGAPASWFMNLLEREKRRLRRITTSASNTAVFLKSQSVGDSIQLHKLIKAADGMGVDYRRESFLRRLVEAAVLRELRLLKYKARIPVSKGMTLFGVMDCTGFLKADEVYITYDTKEGRYSFPPGDGARVLVTRSPALHPGDIQLAFNREPPTGHPLSELTDCIVFSQKGHRDLPSQLSGGDLDGDVYNVFWDPDLVHIPFLQTFSPADYPRVPPLELDREVRASDMADFFVDFMKADQLGIVATRHMILADRHEDGTLDPDCIKLAELHSSAVDFSKTGRPVDMSQIPRSEDTKSRPDFFAPGPEVYIHDKADIEMADMYMVEEDEEEDEDGPRYRYYRSEKVLGHLYRAVDEQKIWAEDIHKTLPMGGASFWDELITSFKRRIRDFIGGDVRWEHRREEAERIRDA